MAKRISAVILALTMLLALAACGGTAASSTTASGSAKPSASGSGVTSTAKSSTAASSGSADTKTINVGLLLQLSGASPADSKELLKGCQMIADIINKKTDYNLPLAKTEGLPNLNGAKIAIEVGDVASNDVAASECERLITQKNVVAFAGIVGSAAVKIAATTFEKYGIPYVTNASSPSLTTSGFKYLVRIFPDDSLYCEAVFKMIDDMNKNENAGIKSVALVSEDSEFGTNIGKIEASLAQKYNLKIAENITYSASATNVTSEVLKLKASNADVVMFSSYTADGILYLQTMKEQNYYPKMLVGQRSGFSRNEMFQSVGAGMEYVYNTSAWSTDLSAPNVQLMTKLFKEASGNDIQEGVMRAMTDFYTICLAVNQAGSTEPDKIMAEYRKGIEIPDDQKWIGVNVKVGDNGQNLEGSSVVLQAFNGTYCTVYPKNLASKSYVYPVPDWSKR